VGAKSNPTDYKLPLNLVTAQAALAACGWEPHLYPREPIGQEELVYFRIKQRNPFAELRLKLSLGDDWCRMYFSAVSDFRGQPPNSYQQYASTERVAHSMAEFVAHATRVPHEYLYEGKYVKNVR